jgi:2-polyprenyl-3-methyl-5-hydroxy-6-metoxy-1,4-benzoquinol methylase
MIRSSLFDYDKKPETYFTATRFEMVPFVPESTKTLLDIGCSNGIFGESVKKKLGTEVWGMEISKPAIKIANQKLDKVLTGYLDQNLKLLKNNYFDVISFNDVLEHMDDPYKSLVEIKSKLSKNGVIVASIPNIRYIKTFLKLIFKKEWNYTDDGILDRTHLRFFTEKTILKMFEETGYEVLKIQGINSIPGWKSLVIKIFTLGLCNDILHLQFAVVAKPK